MRNRYTKYLIITIACVFLSLVAFFAMPAKASGYPLASKQLEVTPYEMPDNESYKTIKDDDTSNRVDTFSYGNNHAGNLMLAGNLSDEFSFRGNTTGFCTDNNKISFTYVLTKTDLMNTDNKDEWHIENDGERTIEDVTLKDEIKSGVAILQKSTNNNVWNTIGEITDFMNSENKKFDNIDINDLRTGMYFRVLVAYKVRRRTGGWWAFSSYEGKRCIEEYKVYLSLFESTIKIKSVVDGSIVNDGDTVSNGFVIENPSGRMVKVTDQDGGTKATRTNATFYKNGTYTIEEYNNINGSFTFNVTVENGFNNYNVNGTTRHLGNDYSLDNIALSTNCITNISLITDGEDTLETNNNNTEFGLNKNKNTINEYSNSVNIKMSVDTSKLENNYALVSDEYGKFDSEKICDVATSEVKSGALIIQKSYDNSTWENIGNDKLSSTDFIESYKEGTDVTIFSPSGLDIITGVYIRIIFAYKIVYANGDSYSYKRVLEETKLFLCSNCLDTILFQNLTEPLTDISEDDLILLNTAETLRDSSVTITGFKVNTELNNVYSISIKKDGSPYDLGIGKRVTEQGQYDITLSNRFGNVKKLTIYVEKRSKEDLVNLYFKNGRIFGNGIIEGVVTGEQNGFIYGKRIYDDGENSVYEGNKTKYKLDSIDNTANLTGYVIMPNGNQVILDKDKLQSENILTIPGIYTIVLNSNATFTYTPTEAAGDNYKFIIKFRIIEEGTAPGPQVNFENMDKYQKNANVSNYYPVYYGVTLTSAKKGYITLAFSTREKAIEFAYNYEKGIVEKQEDGTFRYNGSLKVEQKQKYVDAWNLTDALHYFAEQSVEKLYFDAGDKFTYYTLDDETIKNTENLRTLELEKSVIVVRDIEERNNLLESQALPVIGDKKILYHDYVNNVDVEKQEIFIFISDDNKYDSYSVEIKGKDGILYPLEYNRSLYDQLVEKAFDSGIYTIVEKTIYGDISEYQFAYIKENDNTMELELSYKDGDTERTRTFTSSDNMASLIVNSFKIENVIDNLDPYGTIEVLYGDNKRNFFCIADVKNVESKESFYYQEGMYTIRLFNRLGYSYSIKIEIQDSDYLTIEFRGYGTENLAEKSYQYSETITLANLSNRYGYNFIGYKNDEGKIFKSSVPAVDLNGSTYLESCWEPKKVRIVYANEEFADSICDFGTTQTLQALRNTDNYEFVGWSTDKNATTGDLKIVINTEEDIILYPIYKQKQNTTPTNTTPTQQGTTSNDKTQISETSTSHTSSTDSGSNSGGFPLWAIILIIVVVVVIIIIALIIIF